MKKKSKRRGSFCFAIVLFVIGFLIMTYPLISNLWNQMISETLVSEYKSDINSKSEEELNAEYLKAEEYNRQHQFNTVLDIFGNRGVQEELYMTLLNPSKDGVMGYIEIPRISQRIVIYHATGTKELQKGCGHIAGTSLPIGGEGTHAVLAAHRGLPKAKLFTDIDKLETGDLFFLFVLNRQLSYEVDQIKVVEPECLDDLQIEEGKDYVTLFTCTPYSVNTHRLLVRGHRTSYSEADNGTKTSIDKCKNYWPFITIIALLVLGMAFAIRKSTKKKRGG